MVDGEGEVWARVEEDTARFWIGAGSLPGGLAARHTEESPFVLKLESAAHQAAGLGARVLGAGVGGAGSRPQRGW